MAQVEGRDAGEIVQEIRTAITNVGLDSPAGQGNLELHGVEIAMTTVAEIQVGFKPKFKVPFVGWEIGGEYSYGTVDTHQLEVSLVTPWGEEKVTDDERKEGQVDITNILPAAVHSLREILEVAQAGDLRLNMKKSKASFKFELTKEGKLELAVPSGGKKWGSTIQVTFTFGTGAR
jgi:hypothetical protein